MDVILRKSADKKEIGQINVYNTVEELEEVVHNEIIAFPLNDIRIVIDSERPFEYLH